MNSLTLFVPFSRFLLIKSWRQCLCLVVSICVGGALSHSIRPGAALSGCLLLMVVIALFSALSLAETHQQSTSGFPSYMFLLPMSNVKLVVWPMAISAVLLAVAGGSISIVVLGPVASLSDTWWLAPYLAGNVSIFQAVTWIPLKRPEIRALLGFVSITFIVLGPLTFAAGIAGPLSIGLVYVALMLVSIAVCVRSVGLARCGLAMAGSFGEAYRIPDLKAFPTRLETQAWFEEKRNGLIMKVISGMFIILFAILAIVGVPWHSAFTEVAGEQLSVVALLWASLALVVPPFFGFGGACGSEQDNVAKDRSIVPFLALRPLTTYQIVEAKALMSARMAVRLAIPSVVVALVVLLLPTSLGGSYRPTIIPLAHILSFSQALGLVVAYGFVLLGGIKGSVSAIWIAMGRLPQWLVVFLTVVPLLVNSSIGVWLITRPDEMRWFISFLPNVIYGFAAFKLIALVPIFIRLRASKLVPENIIVIWFLGCTVAGVALFCFASRAIPAAVYSRWALAAQVFVMLPLLRIMLAPLAVHRGRHG